MASIFLFMSLTTSRVTHKTKYSISVCLKKDFSVLHLSPYTFSLLIVNSKLCIWSFQYPLVNINILSMYQKMNSNPWNKSFIFCWKFSGEFTTPIGRCLYRYFPHGRIIVHKLLAFSLNWVWYYPIFKSSDVAYWKPSNFNNISFIFGIGCGFRFNFLFRFLNSIRKHNRFYLGLGCANDEDPNYE